MLESLVVVVVESDFFHLLWNFLPPRLNPESKCPFFLDSANLDCNVRGGLIERKRKFN